MRAVVQRVRRGSVTVDQEVIGEIGRGYVVLLGVAQGDAESDADYLADKIANLRIFPDAQGKMNLSLLDVGGEVLVISQFTLMGDCRHGRRPGFSQAAPPEIANHLYEYFAQKLSSYGIEVKKGKFQADMLVEIINDGPVTMLLDSKKLF